MQNLFRTIHSTSCLIQQSWNERGMIQALQLPVEYCVCFRGSSRI